jgi:hypothetical protein
LDIGAPAANVPPIKETDTASIFLRYVDHTRLRGLWHQGEMGVDEGGQPRVTGGREVPVAR